MSQTRQLCVFATAVAALVSVSTPLRAEPSDPNVAHNILRNEITRLLQTPALRYSKTSLYVTDGVSDVVTFKPDRELNPASNVKLVATATALETLGPDWRYETRILGPSYFGREDKIPAIISNDVFILGSFDPTLSRQRLEDIARKLAAKGLKRIDGNIVVDTEPDRTAMTWPYIKVTVGGTSPGMSPWTQVQGELPYVRVTVDAKTVAVGQPTRLTTKTQLSITEAGQPEFHIRISGRIESGAKRWIWKLAADPSLHVGHELRRALVAAGIVVSGDVKQQSLSAYMRIAAENFIPVTLYRDYSRPLRDIVSATNKWSINSWADRLVMTAGAALYGGKPTLKKAVRAMKSWLARSAKVSPNSVTLDTGSGLSYTTRITPRQIVKVLRAATGENASPAPAWTDSFASSLSIAGVDGTLRKRFKTSAVATQFRGKSGTLTQISALSGVLPAADGRDLYFSIVTNDHLKGYRWNVRRRHEEIVTALHKYVRRSPN